MLVVLVVTRVVAAPTAVPVEPVAPVAKAVMAPRAPTVEPVVPVLQLPVGPVATRLTPAPEANAALRSPSSVAAVAVERLLLDPDRGPVARVEMPLLPEVVKAATVRKAASAAPVRAVTPLVVSEVGRTVASAALVVAVARAAGLPVRSARVAP